MVVFNYANRELTAKIVYYGPGLCGKTTNLEIIHKKIAPDKRGQMMSLATETDRTLCFDLLPIDLGTIGGFKLKLQLFTVPGQTYYDSTRKLALRGADGVVFVADSREGQIEANKESMQNLRINLSDNNIDFDKLPLVIQFNKQDLKPLASDKELNAALNPRGAPIIKAIALSGQGVLETFKIISQEVVKYLKGKIGKGVAPAPGAGKPVRRAPSQVAQIKVKTEKFHIPSHAAASKEQIKREASLERHEVEDPVKTIETWLNLINGGISDMNTPEALNLVKNIKRNLVGLIDSNRKQNVQYEDLFRLMDKLGSGLKEKEEQK